MAAEMSRGHAVESWPVTPDPEVGIPSPPTRKWESRPLRPGSRTHFCLFSAQGLTIKLKLEPVRPQAVGHLRLVRCRFLGPTASDSKGPGGPASAFSEWPSGGPWTILKGTGSWSRRLRF